MLQCAVRLFNNSRWHQNVVKTKMRGSEPHWAVCECVTAVLTKFWRLLWSVSEQTHAGLHRIYTVYIMSRKETTTYLPRTASYTVRRFVLDFQVVKNLSRFILFFFFFLIYKHLLEAIFKSFHFLKTNLQTISKSRPCWTKNRKASPHVIHVSVL